MHLVESFQFLIEKILTLGTKAIKSLFLKEQPLDYGAHGQIQEFSIVQEHRDLILETPSNLVGAYYTRVEFSGSLQI